MAALTAEEKQFLRSLVRRELQETQQDERDFAVFLSNSPVLSSLMEEHDRSLPFLASQERYIRFLKDLARKLT